MVQPQPSPEDAWKRAARRARLRYVSAGEPGFARRRRGSGFSYLTTRGTALRDPAHLARIRSLAVPPAWQDVWICRDARGHLQATGRDARGRKQYRYHPRWRAVRDADKFGELAAFGRSLSKVRKRVDRGLSLRGVPREKVLCAIVRLIDREGLRVGSEEYADLNGTFGVTTLQDRHARVDGRRVRLSFRGKNALRRGIDVTGRRLARAVRACRDLPGQRLFQYEDDDGVPREVRSEDVNAWLREVSGLDATAKTFRTWRASALAAGLLARVPSPASARGRERAMRAAIEEVAESLGNTPPVCRRCYVLPALLDEYAAGRPPSLSARGPGALEPEERALLEVLGRFGP